MSLRYGRVERLSDGFSIDPRPYLAELPRLASVLPGGAYKFVADVDHYKFFSERSIKDLKVDRMELSDKFATIGISLCLGYNELPDVPRLMIEYQDVVSFSVDAKPGFSVRSGQAGKGVKRLGSILMDEVLPSSHGCVHVIELVNGTISVDCRDLEAVWS